MKQRVPNNPKPYWVLFSDYWKRVSSFYVMLDELMKIQLSVLLASVL